MRKKERKKKERKKERKKEMKVYERGVSKWRIGIE